MRILTLVTIPFLLMLNMTSCEPPPVYNSPELVPVETKTEDGIDYNFQVNMYTKTVDDCSPMYVYRDRGSISVETGAYEGEIRFNVSDFKIISCDSVRYDSVTKIRYLVEATDEILPFAPQAYIFEQIGNIFVVDENIYISSEKDAIKAFFYANSGIISNHSPYIYTLRKNETLKQVAEKFATSEELLLYWNKNLFHGYGEGDKVTVLWYKPAGL